MGDFVGLPGVKAGKIRGNRYSFARSMTRIMANLRRSRVVSAAGDHGIRVASRDRL